MLLPRFHRVVLSLVAGAAAIVSCVLVGEATSDVVQCVWALSAGVSLAVVAAAWWPANQTAASSADEFA